MEYLPKESILLNDRPSSYIRRHALHKPVQRLALPPAGHQPRGVPRYGSWSLQEVMVLDVLQDGHMANTLI